VSYQTSPPPYPSWGPPPPAPQPRRRTPIIAAMVVTAVLLAGGVTAGAWWLMSGAHPTGSSSAGSSSAGSASPTPEPTHTGDLRKLLIVAPARAKPWSHPLGTNGQLSLDQVAALSTDEGVRRRELTDDGFTHGAVRCWEVDDLLIDVRLLQFNSPANAAAFELADQPLSGKPVAGVPHATYSVDAKGDKYGYVAALAVGVRGDLVIVVDVAQKPGVDRTKLQNLVQQQYALL
jgi:hypothetical protein